MPGTQDPGLADLLREATRAGLAKVHTSFPATVVVYNPLLNSATVQPAIHSRVDDVLLDIERPDPVPPPVLSNVPVMWPSGGGATPWSIHGPLAPGDPVTVFIAERSTDEWRTLGGPLSIPLDARRFDLSDAVCYPGGRALGPTNPLTAPLPLTAIDAIALVLAGTLVKLGAGPTAIHQVLHGETFEADLLTWLSAFDAVLAVLSTPPVGSPAAWIATVTGATATFLTAQAAFKTTVSSGVHRSIKVFTE